MTMIEARIESLVRLLSRGTAQDLLEWEETADEDTFRLVSATGNIRIEKTVRFDDETAQSYPYRCLTILNEKGRTIEEYTPTGATEFYDFDKLFDNARRSAYNTEEILSRIINDISVKIGE